ncbi:MAG TPA: CRTAC1 family protein, partial [Acidobacteriota bacterium]|nr:CRTAC1 family protein [Acidobacteriota bacterium]
NLGDGTFADVGEWAGKAFQKLEVSRGTAFGDVDNNGAMDVLVTANNGPARLLLNRVETENHWIGLNLISRHGGRAPLGARVRIKLPSGRSLWRTVRTDGSYLSASDGRLLVGLGGEDEIETVRVFWPGGEAEAFSEVSSGRYNELVQGEGETAR